MKSIATSIAAIALSLFATLPAEAAKYGSWPGDEAPGTIVIVTGDHTLHYISAPGERISFPIAVGREGDKWFGQTTVIGKKEDPDWRPTPDMRRADPKLPAVVKAGPNNPLGNRAIYLAQGYLRIHGTNNQHSVGKDVSHGCFRLYRKDIEELFSLVSVGSTVEILP